EPEEPSLRDRGLRDFRETVAEAEGLGVASAEAKRAAHATFEAMPVEPPRIEPHISTESASVTEPAVRPKIADRIGQSGTTAPNTANAPAAAVAQKVVLYDEDASDPQGKRYV